MKIISKYQELPLTGYALLEYTEKLLRQRAYRILHVRGDFERVWMVGDLVTVPHKAVESTDYARIIHVPIKDLTRLEGSEPVSEPERRPEYDEELLSTAIEVTDKLHRKHLLINRDRRVYPEAVPAGHIVLKECELGRGYYTVECSPTGSEFIEEQVVELHEDFMPVGKITGNYYLMIRESAVKRYRVFPTEGPVVMAWRFTDGVTPDASILIVSPDA